jgi:UDP-N-acetylmuramoyl-L-alanyl-D-glutamate--2,6-diaminopimelate ligase
MGRMTVRRSLNDLLRAAGLSAPAGFPDVRVSGLKTDSRTVEPGDAFIALRGSRHDGAGFAAEAALRGATALLVETADAAASHVLEAGVPTLHQPDLRAFTGPLFDAWHGHPSRRMEFYGVTGTNGKSTTVLLMAAILRAAGRKVVSLGTIRYQIGDEVLDSTLTAPSAESFYGLIARGAEAGCDAVVMEVSSHALSQDRVRGVLFRRAVFTNLTQDHLDFHAGFEDYFAAKKRLFTGYLSADGMGVINLDTPYGLRLLAEWDGARFTFTRESGIGSGGAGTKAAKPDLALRKKELSLKGTRLLLESRDGEFNLESPLIGDLNVENLLAATAFGLSLGLSPDVVARGIAGVTVPGRNEVFHLSSVAGGVEGAFAVVDYAHTPDALERVLNSLRPLTPGRLHVVFGCGGDRDRGKRPLMGGIAERLADRVILTSDNPRGEDPEAILAGIRAGMRDPGSAAVIVDRREAIRDGLQHLKAGDCLLVAGKGHEDYQILGDRKVHFSDQEEIASWN